MAGWTTLNPSDTQNGTLSGGNLVVTQSGTGKTLSRAIDGYALGTTAKYYFEIAGMGNAGSTFDEGVGLALLAATYTDLTSSAVNGALIQPDAAVANQVNIAGANIYANLVAPTPSLACIAIDLGAKKWWSKPTAASGFGSIVWNNDVIANQNPATGAGGFSLAALGTAVVYPVVIGQSGLTNVFTANFGQNAFGGAVPAGFTAGWPGSTPDIPTDLHQTGATLTSITMAWAQGGSTTPDSYTLQYRLTGTMSWTQVPGLMTTSTTIMGLLQATQYDFQVLQIVSGTPSAFTATAVGSTLTPPAPVPPQPQALSNVPRSSGGIYRGQVGINFMGNVLVGDAFSGVVGKMNFDTFTEYGNPMWGLIASPPIHDDRKRVFLTRFEIDVESGVGLLGPDGAPGVDPVWMLDWSKDGGRTFGSPQLFRTMGRVGQYLMRLRWLRLGNSRQWILRLQSTDPVRRVIIGTYVDVTKGVG